MHACKAEAPIRRSISPGMKAVVMMVLVTATAMNSLLCRSLFHSPLCVWCTDIEVHYQWSLIPAG